VAGRASARPLGRGSGGPRPLFVYGTLQDPQRLRTVLGPAARWRVLGAGTIRGVLYDAGPYPALRRSDSPADIVPGLLLELEDESLLVALDRYEGVDSGLYLRERVQVYTADGAQQDAWAYTYNRSVAGFRRIQRWPSGDDNAC
jgi:gamma-glutamylcyclotransferase (GGCT)/AIG2-like uncharacterized protein YtfP